MLGNSVRTHLGMTCSKFTWSPSLQKLQSAQSTMNSDWGVPSTGTRTWRRGKGACISATVVVGICVEGGWGSKR